MASSNRARAATHPAPGNGPAWRIRPAVESDVDRLRALVAGCGLPEAGVGEQLEGFAVAVVAGRIVGVAGLERHGGHGLLRSVAVEPEWRGRGVADALVADRLRRAREEGMPAVHLLTTTASGWFARLGFRAVPRSEVPDAVRRSEEFAAICPDTAVVMVRDLEKERHP
jgi:amino-acid N-acetyltransferase